MLRFYANNFTAALGQISELRAVARSLTEKTLDDDSKKVCSRIVLALATSIVDMDLRYTMKACARVDEAIEKQSALTLAELSRMLDDIDRRMHDELEDMYILALTSKEHDLYTPNDPLFDNDVAAKIASAAFDIEESGKCLAVGRYTACVFHLMRTMERGAQQFAAVLGLSIKSASGSDESWNSITTKIQRKVDALSAGDKNKPVYNSILSYLHSVRIAWRNETMHPKATYTQEEAESVFTAVRSFMKELAKTI